MEGVKAWQAWKPLSSPVCVLQLSWVCHESGFLKSCNGSLFVELHVVRGFAETATWE